MTKDKFEEIKAKMVLKLKDLNRRAALTTSAASEVRHAAHQINREDDDDCDLKPLTDFFGED